MLMLFYIEEISYKTSILTLQGWVLSGKQTRVLMLSVPGFLACKFSADVHTPVGDNLIW